MSHGRPSRSRAGAGALALALVALATAAGADPAGVPLAAPGPCAESRAVVGAAPDDSGAPAPVPVLEGEAGGGFDVAGSPRHHFTPGDVAAPEEAGGADLPQLPTFTRDPCDAPLAGCGSILRRGGVGIDEPPVGTGD